MQLLAGGAQELDRDCAGRLPGEVGMCASCMYSHLFVQYV